MNLKGKKNVYLCKSCGKGFATQDIDEGVTPFMLTCTCGEMMESFFYKVPSDWIGEPYVIWRFPTEEEAEELNPHIKAHVEKGGLLPFIKKTGDRYVGDPKK